MPRNQIAAFSGLSNTYIRDLEAGNYASVRREKLIALAVAVNINLQETDRLLEIFDRTPLTADDIPTFLETAAGQRASGALLPLRDGFPLELALLSAERRPGPQVVVNPQPPFSLFEEGHRRHIERRNLDDHPIYGELVEAISRERRRVLDQNLARHRVEQFICRECLELYTRGEDDPADLQWRRKHIANVIRYLGEQPNFFLHVVQFCPTASFTLKFAPDTAPNGDQIFLVFWPRHQIWGKRSGRLSGFTTTNPVVIDNFKEEVASLSRVVVEEFQRRERLAAYLRGLIAP